MYKCRDEAGNVERRRRKKKERRTWNRPRVRFVFAHHHHHHYQPYTCVIRGGLFFSSSLSSSFSFLHTYWRWVHTSYIFVSFSEHLNIIFDLFDDIISFLENWCFYIIIYRVILLTIIIKSIASYFSSTRHYSPI